MVSLLFFSKQLTWVPNPLEPRDYNPITKSNTEIPQTLNHDKQLCVFHPSKNDSQVDHSSLEKSEFVDGTQVNNDVEDTNTKAQRNNLRFLHNSWANLDNMDNVEYCQENLVEDEYW